MSAKPVRLLVMCRSIQNPAVSALLVLVLYFWGINLGRGSALARYLDLVSSSVNYGHPEMQINRDADGTISLSRNASDKTIGLVAAWGHWSQRGLLAPTESQLDHTVSIQLEPSAQMSKQEMTQTRALYVEQFLAPGRDARTMALFRSGDGVTTFPIPGAYIVNGGYLFVAGFFVWSMGWLPRRIRQGAVQDRAKRRATAGLCTTCGYDLHGTSSGICPECGHDRSTPA